MPLDPERERKMNQQADAMFYKMTGIDVNTETKEQVQDAIHQILIGQQHETPWEGDELDPSWKNAYLPGGNNLASEYWKGPPISEVQPNASPERHEAVNGWLAILAQRDRRVR